MNFDSIEGLMQDDIEELYNEIATESMYNYISADYGRQCCNGYTSSGATCYYTKYGYCAFTERNGDCTVYTAFHDGYCLQVGKPLSHSNAPLLR